MQNNPAPSVTLADIRGVYDHLPTPDNKPSAMNHPAILVFAHDPENAANAAGQAFLTKNNDPYGRNGQPMAVAAQMIGADYKIFDLTPPERQPVPASEADLALALSYGMVTIEQGVDFVCLYAVGQETDELCTRIASFDDILAHGAMNIAACYGAYMAARMGQIEITMPDSLARCLENIAESEDIACQIPALTGDVKDIALELIRQRALRLINL